MSAWKIVRIKGKNRRMWELRCIGVAQHFVKSANVPADIDKSRQDINLTIRPGFVRFTLFPGVTYGG